MAGIEQRPEQVINPYTPSRREVLKAGGMLAVAAATTPLLFLTTEQTVAAQGQEDVPGHEVLDSNVGLWFVPFLPATERGSIAHVKTLPEYDNGELQWDKLVTARTFLPDAMNAAVDPNNRYAERARAVNAYARAKGWVGKGESYLAYEQVFSYPSVIMADDATLNKGRNVEFWSNGRQVKVDALQLNSYTVAVAPIAQKNMVMFSNPREFGQVRARLIDGVTEGEVAIAFAKNKHVDTLSPADDDSGVPAIHVNGYPNAPVRLTYYIPTNETRDTNDQSKFNRVVIDATLSDAGDLAVHLPEGSDFYQGDFATAVVVQVYTKASNEHGETEVEFRMGSDDDSPGKNRVTEADVLAAISR